MATTYDNAASIGYRRGLRLLHLLMVTMFVSCACSSVQCADFKLLIAFDKTNPATPIVGEGFARSLEAASKGEMKVQINGPETVPTFEQLQPVAAGVFDFGLTTGGYHAGTITAATVLDGMNVDLDQLRSSGMIDEIDKHYQRLGLKIIAVPYLAKNGFQIILREPIGSDGSLKGRKIRATPQYRPMLTLLGAAEVVMPNAETYAALDKGVVDGAAWTSIGILSAKFYEVNKFLLRPQFGASHIMIVMNLNRWKRLSDDDKQLVEHTARSIEKTWSDEFARMAAEEEAKLIKDHGMKVTNMGESFSQRTAEVMSEGTWALARSRNPALVDELRKFAREKGVSK